MSTQKFTREQGLAVQAEQLAKLRQRLNFEAMRHLSLHVVRENAKLPQDADGYAVFRGVDLDMVVANWHPEPVLETDTTPPAPREIARAYEAALINHDPADYPMDFPDFARCCQIEDITRHELLDIEFICDRIDVWSEL